MVLAHKHLDTFSFSLVTANIHTRSQFQTADAMQRCQRTAVIYFYSITKLIT